MKLPEYTTKVDIKVQSQNQEIVFPAGTLIQPFWNETFLPEHLREKLKEEKRRTEENLIMCAIGREWVVLPEKAIRRNGW